MTADNILERHLQAYKKARSILRNPAAAAHCMGIGGVGVAGLAFLLHSLGTKVTGCDPGSGKYMRWLETRGIRTFPAHSAAHLHSLKPERGDFIIRSPAVPYDEPELVAAHAAGLPVLDRGVMLSALMDTLPNTIAVCGTHGKTTTATFIATLLRDMGVDAHWCIGGDSPKLGALAGYDPTAPEAPLVAECDESDGTLALYHPGTTVLTGVDYEHLEHFGSMNALKSVFKTVLAQTSKTIIFRCDDPIACELAGDLPNSIGYGLHSSARINARNIEGDASGSDFDLVRDGRELGRFRIGVPGPHNLCNALAALATLDCGGLDIAVAASRLEHGLSLPGRRFECVADDNDIRVLSDYAHHPVEIAAMVNTALMQKRRIVAVFQPHRYTRTLAMARKFPQAFAGVSALALAPVHSASESPIPGGASADLALRFSETARNNASIPLPYLLDNLDSALLWLREEVRSGDLVLIIGAGTIGDLAEKIRRTPGKHHPLSITAI